MLTIREKEVLTLIAHGLNQEQIAQTLKRRKDGKSMSPKTVQGIISTMLLKLEIHRSSRHSAYAYMVSIAVANDWIDISDLKWK